MTTYELLPVLKAFELAKGIRPSPVSISRWATKGSNGIKLKIEKVGKLNLTTVEWVNEFVAATTAKYTEPAQSLELEASASASTSTELTARQRRASMTASMTVSGGEKTSSQAKS